MTTSYPIETVREAYLLAEQGLAPADIAREIGGTLSRKTVWTWLRNPDSFSPFLDEVALERALLGEREVFKNLSTYERQEFWERSAKLSAAEQVLTADRDCKYNNNLSRQLGMNVSAICSAHTKARNRARSSTGTL